MNIHCSGQNIDVTTAIKDHIQQKFKILSKHFTSIIDIHVHIKVEKQQHIAEACLEVSGSSLFASAQNDDMYAAIEALVHKLDRQIIKYKEKHADHHTKDITHHMPSK